MSRASSQRSPKCIGKASRRLSRTFSLGIGERPFRQVHRAHQEVERLVDRRPAVDQGIVPVEQDGSRRGATATRQRLRASRRARHAAPRRAPDSAARSLRLSGPGLPSPTGAPSMPHDRQQVGRRAGQKGLARRLGFRDRERPLDEPVALAAR